MKISPVTLDDFYTMVVDWRDHMDCGSPPVEYWSLVLQVAATAGLWLDDKLVLILGIIHDGAGVGTIFVISSVFMQNRKYQKVMLKQAYPWIDRLSRLYNIHRLQAIVLPSNQTHVAFIEHFGFKREGTLEDYTPAGQDVFMYGKSLRRA